MRVIEADEIESTIGEVLREVESGQTIEVTRQGQVVARLSPVQKQLKDRDANGAWTELLRLRDEISANWPEGVSAQDAINDVRREL